MLGRRRKLRTALTFGAAAAVGRLSTDPQTLLKQGSKLLGAGPQVGQVAGLGKPLATAGKAAAAAAVSHGIDSVGDRIRQRADALRGAPGVGVPRPGGEEPVEERRERGAEAEGEPQRRGEPATRGEPETERAEGEGAEPEVAEAKEPEAEEFEAAEPQAEAAEAEEPEAEEEPEPPAPVRRRAPRAAPTTRATPTARARRRPAEEETGEAQPPPVRRPRREQPAAGGAPVRRRGR